MKEPKQTVKAYKLFRVDERRPGELFPLFVDANTPVKMGEWVDAKEGEMVNGKVKSKIGQLAYRPGWHAGDLPIATHIGEKSHPNLTAPDRRPSNHAWAEVEMPNDVDWQSIANERGTNAQGRVVPVKAHITDQIPHGGHYRYKTNPNMTGNWLIGGSMKVNRVLTDAEVKKINKAAGLSDLPRATPFKKKDYGFKSGGLVAPHTWISEEIVNHDADGIAHKASGGSMDQPLLAQYRVNMGKHTNPDLMDSIGVNEAMDMNPKIFMNPNPRSPGIPDVGGVATQGGLPIGGVDQNPQQAGKQLTPQPLAPQPPQQGGLPQQPEQSEQPSVNAPPSPFGAPTGAMGGTPMGNLLSMTPQGQQMQAMRAPQQPATPPQMAVGGVVHLAKGGDVESTRITIPGTGYGGVKGINVPRHMWEGKTYGGTGPRKGQHVEGMKEINQARAKVYGAEHRDPLTIGDVEDVHKSVLAHHFGLPLDQQLEAEQAALAKLRAAKHLGDKANTLDESEKLDTVRHERDPAGRAYVGYASKGVAGHSLYTSGAGKNIKHHVINTCPGQTVGCGGGVDKNGIVDTSKGTCFAPNAESQYVNAAVRRATHEQAKHDPAMTSDWILAHTGSLREAANNADKENLVTLFRPNVVDETDVSSRHVIKGLNEQRQAENKPMIIANSYGKTNELHDPANGYFVTHSNIGPKTKHGASIKENIQRDANRVRATILAADASGQDYRNEDDEKTPPKNSYMVTNVRRGSDMDKAMQGVITHAKYWSRGRPVSKLNEMELSEGDEAHYNGKGERTTPAKAHYGHMVLEGNRYDYQKQHILHPRLVNVPQRKKNKETGEVEEVTHMIPTDSRFKDDEELDKRIPRNKQFKTRNGKRAGLILMTTPTTSTPNHLHHSSFTHDVSPAHLEYAAKNNGEYEIDPPLAQHMSAGKEYAPPQPIKFKADGGSIEQHRREGYEDDGCAFPEQSFYAQSRNANKVGMRSIHEVPEEDLHRHYVKNGQKMMPSVMHSNVNKMRDELALNGRIR
jgi:hypothetical protein